MKFPSIIVTAVPLLLTSLAGAPVSAARRVAILAPEARGSGAAKLSRATHARLLRLLSSDTIEAVSPSRKQAAALRRCSPGRRALCQRAARPLRADLVLISRIAKRGKRLQVTLRLVSVDRAVLAGSTVVREPAGAGAPSRIAAAARALLLAQRPAGASPAAQARVPAPAEVPVAAAVQAQAVDREESPR